MSRLSSDVYFFLLALGLCFGPAGCSGTPSQSVASAPLTVSVSYPITREVTDHADYTARTAAVDSVEVRARVWGYLDKVNFKEGALVNKGDVLFEIDPRTYLAALAQAEGKLASAQAKLTRSDADLARASELMRTKAISREDFDKAVADKGEAAAALAALKAGVDQAKLDLGFTKVTAPISGRVGRALVTEGNLILAGQTGGTVLTTLVSVDPIYAYFDVDETTVQRVRRLIREGKAKSARDIEIPVWLGLATEEGHPHKGIINFVDNQVNPKTGTLKLRGVFNNENELLSPGYFARVRVPIGFPHQALLVTDRAIDTDQGQKIVYVVDQENKVVARPIRVGALHEGLRVIDEGLSPTDKVLVNGLQQVRPGIVVTPNLIEMPGARKLEVGRL
ncbi:MAG: efflux RND transporter periplasmic adaptor subunit [Planctomycetes bacterium]|nr:efflux RND transporter periplasmic adaptor subunit [Planctomycetota bacterium]